MRKVFEILMAPAVLALGCAAALWLALDREARIEAEMEWGGEDAVSDADKAWCAARFARTTSDERRVTNCGVAK